MLMYGKREETNPETSLPSTATPVTMPITPNAKPIVPVETPISAGDGGLFSNLSSITKSADALLTPIVKSNKEEEKEDANITGESKEQSLDSKMKPMSTPKATPTPKVSAQTPIFTPGGSLFSRMTNLAQTADSLLTAAVQQSTDVGDNKILERSETNDIGGWDEDTDDDFFDDEEKDDEHIVEHRLHHAGKGPQHRAFNGHKDQRQQQIANVLAKEIAPKPA